MNSVRVLSVFVLGSSLLAALFFGGCGTARPVENSTAYRTAVKLNEEGERAWKSQEFRIALSRYREAAEVFRAIEFSEGLAINLLNQAILMRQLGDRAGCGAALEEILGHPELEFPEPLLARAALYLARLRFEQGNIEAAAEAAARAVKWDRQSGRALDGEISLVRARVALRQDRPAEALPLLERARDAGNPRVEADSWRMYAALRAGQERWEDARTGYEEALRRDKDLGRPRPIVRDLLALGKVLARLGHPAEARNCFLRAASAARGSRDEAGQQEATAAAGRLAESAGSAATPSRVSGGD